jgi:hypothetical protein
MNEDKEMEKLDNILKAIEQRKKQLEQQQKQQQTQTLTTALATPQKDTDMTTILQQIATQQKNQDTPTNELINKKEAAEELLPYLKIIQRTTIIAIILPMITLFLGVSKLDLPGMIITVIIAVYLALVLRKASMMKAHIQHKYQIMPQPGMLQQFTQNMNTQNRQRPGGY